MIDVFETQSSTRRSTRDKPPAISSTARWRSSIRACSETAKSTRSSFPPPSSTSCPCRTRRSLRHASTATANEPSATTAATTAIDAATLLESSTAASDTYGSENTTGYSLELFVVVFSPGTGCTSTLTGVVGPNGG